MNSRAIRPSEGSGSYFWLSGFFGKRGGDRQEQSFGSTQDEQVIGRQRGSHVPAKNQRVGQRENGEIQPGVSQPGPDAPVLPQGAAASDQVKERVQHQPDANPGDAEGQVFQEGCGVVLQQADKSGFGREPVGQGLGCHRVRDRAAEIQISKNQPTGSGDQKNQQLDQQPGGRKPLLPLFLDDLP